MSGVTRTLYLDDEWLKICLLIFGELVKGFRFQEECLESIHAPIRGARGYAPDPVSQGGAVERERVEQTGAQPMAHPPPVGAMVESRLRSFVLFLI
jgi:hypothetical protein